MVAIKSSRITKERKREGEIVGERNRRARRERGAEATTPVESWRTSEQRERERENQREQEDNKTRRPAIFKLKYIYMCAIITNVLEWCTGTWG